MRSLLGDESRRAAAAPEVHLLLAEAEFRLGSAVVARDRLEEIIPQFIRAGDGPSLRKSVNMLGAAHLELGDLEAAESAFAEVIELANSDGDILVMARATNNLGIIAHIRGRYGSALSMYQLAVPAYQRIGSALGLAESCHNMAISYRVTEQLSEADEYERRAIEFARESGNSRLAAMAGVGRAEVALLRGDASLARVGAERGARAFSAIPDPLREADAWRLVGVASVSLGETDGAVAALDRALLLAREHGSALIEAEARRARAELWLALERTDRARDDARAAEALFQKLGSAAELAAVRALLAKADGGESASN
ncbi:MAG TPA: tetratricopeptide repeat protein [Gemmatimonadaceae bacterium]|nr:tetratricopeptide repeat protein [Gemmatimonadaceae bacterium]